MRNKSFSVLALEYIYIYNYHTLSVYVFLNTTKEISSERRHEYYNASRIFHVFGYSVRLCFF